jgi:hypothetical protein
MDKHSDMALRVCVACLQMRNPINYEKSAGRWYNQCFRLDISCRKMYTLISALLHRQT